MIVNMFSCKTYSFEKKLQIINELTQHDKEEGKAILAAAMAHIMLESSYEYVTCPKCGNSHAVYLGDFFGMHCYSCLYNNCTYNPAKSFWHKINKKYGVNYVTPVERRNQFISAEKLVIRSIYYDY